MKIESTLTPPFPLTGQGRKHQSGQVAIIVLLVSAVMLTLGLSMSKRESTNIKINTNDELIKKAFDTAESGIDYYLGTGNVGYSAPGNTAFAKITAQQIGNGTNKIDFGEYTLGGSSENYWLVNHLATGDIGATYFTGPSVDVCASDFTGVAEISLFSRTNLRRFLANIDNNCTNIPMAIASPVLLTVTPLSGGGKFYIQANNGGLFVSQGMDIVSEGSAGGTNKKLSIRQRFKLPGFLTSGMMAEGSILSD